MGQKSDQNYFQETYRPLDHRERQGEASSTLNLPPPLPPRRPDAAALQSSEDDIFHEDEPPSYTGADSATQPPSVGYGSQATQSIVPNQSTGNPGRRKLLAVFIHGFMGNETSFQSFPADVHNLITADLAKSHIVHTKIYPRYKSRKHIEHARDAFSDWLRPHEGPNVDVILLGHSMGGILSAEVALLECHRILGTINFDTPFLGMHPGVIASGLGSLFKPAPDTPTPKPDDLGPENQSLNNVTKTQADPSSPSTSYFGPDASSGSMLKPTQSNLQASSPVSPSLSPSISCTDPNFDPPFVNDVRIPQRSGWANALHFVNKHSDDMRKATQTYVMSHLEFGGVMADYKGLKKRYERIVALEDADPNDPKRLRFVNYYTASTGRPKKPKSARSSTDQQRQSDDEAVISRTTEHEKMDEPRGSGDDRSQVLTPKISLECSNDTSKPEPENDTGYPEVKLQEAGDAHSEENEETPAQALELVEPIPMAAAHHMDESISTDIHKTTTPAQLTDSSTQNPQSTPSTPSIPIPTRPMPPLPPLPPTPSEPTPFNPTQYPDSEIRKLAKKEHARQVKTYQQATKDREKVINDRRKFLEKQEKDSAKMREKQAKAEEKERQKLETRGMETGELERYKIAKGEVEKAEKERVKAEKVEREKVDKARAKAEKEDERNKAKAAKSVAKVTAPEADVNAAPPQPAMKDEKPPRDKKFCMLPPRYKGEIDPSWVRVFMPGMDEVGAHCGLFTKDGERYERFVRDVAGRIELWVGESRT